MRSLPMIYAEDPGAWQCWIYARLFFLVFFSFAKKTQTS
jgi:hypothetical protein